MTDFKAAFEDGIKAAQQAEAAKKEIDSVFTELNKQLSEATRGKLLIERRYMPDEIVGFFISLAEFRRPTHLAITARNPSIKQSEPKELSKWESGRAGYPCKVSWGGNEAYCENKEGLERVLSDLLRDPVVAGILYSLINLETGNTGSEAV
jgi:hypothetical protein